MRTLLLSLVLAVNLPQVQAQEPPPVRTFQRHSEPPVDTPTVAVIAPGDVTLRVAPGIDGTMEQFAEVKHIRKGYRVQVFLGDRKTAEETKRTFLQKYPDTPAYLSWLAPNFRLRVGDLRTRLEAERLLRDMKVIYPGSYIVPDDIEMPRVVED
jgi:hypothetical protein